MKLNVIILTVGILTLAIVASAADLASVNGQKITDQDVLRSLSNYNEGQKRTILSDSQSRGKLVENMIDQELLVQQAERQKLQTSAKYRDAMEVFKRQLLSNLVVEKAIGPRVSDQSARRFHAKHKHKFSTTQVRAFHILVENESQAKSIFNLASKKDADFEALAEKYSKDPSAKMNRGDLGFFTRDKMVPEFSDPVFRAKPGAVLGPIKTVFGYHVVKVVDKKIGRTLEYDEVELQVKAALQQELLEGYLNSLKKNAKIQRNYSKWKP